jgi:hypothetical protein
VIACAVAIKIALKVLLLASIDFKEHFPHSQARCGGVTKTHFEEFSLIHFAYLLYTYFIQK